MVLHDDEAVLHDVEVVIALALQLQLCDVVRVQDQHLQLGHLTQDGHLLNEVVPQVELLEPGQLKIHGADVIVASNDVLEPLQLIQGIDRVQIVLGYVDPLELCHSGHLLQVTKVLQPLTSQAKPVWIVLHSLLNQHLNAGFGSELVARCRVGGFVSRADDFLVLRLGRFSVARGGTWRDLIRVTAAV